MNRYPLIEKLEYDKIDEEIVVYETDGDIYVLNDTAGFIFEKMQENTEAHDIAKALSSQYEVDESKSLSDVRFFIEEIYRKVPSLSGTEAHLS